MTEIFNVRDYGATGDGVTNDTAAIQAAVNAAIAAGGGQVYIPAGTYIVAGDGTASHGAVTLGNNVTVAGDGMGATTVKLQDGYDHGITGIFRTPAGVATHDVGMHDLTIDGNRANTSGEVYGWFNGVLPGDPRADSNITLDHVEIMNCSGYGFDPHEQTVNLVITNSVAHDNGRDGFTLDYQINARIENNIAYNNDRSGFNIVTSSHDVLLRNNVSYGNGQDGIVIQRGSEDIPVPYNIVITGGEIYGNGNDGVSINKADKVTVTGVYIHDNDSHGIRVQGSVGSVITDNVLYNDSREENVSYQEIWLDAANQPDDVSGRIYETRDTLIANNRITNDGPIRANFAIEEEDDGHTRHTTVANNTIIGTDHDTPVLVGEGSTYTSPAPPPPTADPAAPRVLYAPLLGQSNAELFHLSAPDGGSGLSHIEFGLEARTDYADVVTMTNMAVGGSTVNGDRHLNQKPALVWWYPDQNRPGPALLAAVEQMKMQLAALGADSKVAPIVIWGQGETEANELGSPKSEAGRLAAEQRYIQSTRLIFNYIQDHVSHDIQFYIMETGLFNNTAAARVGYPQLTIDKANLGLTYVNDAQIKLALAYDDVHIATNYSDLPMNADLDPSSPGYRQDWYTDTWHLALTSKEVAADRVTNFIALDRGYTHVLENPGPYPKAALADLAIFAGPGVTVTGTANSDIITGTAGTDTINGGDGDDIIVGGGGGDRLTGDAGADTFYYMPAQPGGTPDIITDFKTGAGGDAVDVSALLYMKGYRGTNAVGQGYITITQAGADTLISYDPDGAAGAVAAIPLARLLNVNAGSFDIAKNLVTAFPAGNALVLNPGTPPWAVDDNFTGTLGLARTGNVLANNGQGVDSSPTGLALSTVAATVTSLNGGTAVVDAAGNFSYKPALGFIGTDSFTYTLKDSAGGISVGTVIIDVRPPAGALVGTPGDDALTGGSRADVILGLDGNDVILGGSNDDTIFGGAGRDTLSGNGGNDTLYAFSGESTLFGNDGNDILYAGSAANSLNGGNGMDTIVTGSGRALMTGGAGSDTFVFTTMNGMDNMITDFSLPNVEKIDLSALLKAYIPGAATIADFVRATQTASGTVLSVDTDGAINGANFVDLVTLNNVQGFDVAALAANGQLIVSDGSNAGNRAPVAVNDTFSCFQNQPATGNVLANNGQGADSDPDGNPLSVVLFNGASTGGGTVSLQANGSFTYTPAAGFSGNDTFAYTLLDGHGGTAPGVVTIAVAGPINGTAGNDVINGGSRDDIINGNGGNDTLGGGGGNDVISGGAGDDVLNGNAGNDVLMAVSGNDVLHGNDDNDTLYAGSGADFLYGDNGNDVLVAGTGAATMTGGSGTDAFKFTQATGVVSTVADFRVSQGDVIDIHDVLTGYAAGMNIADFVHATKMGSNSMLSVDTDGAANGAHFVDIALIQGLNFDVNAMLAGGNLAA